jgi:hypothetical protein
MSFDLGAIGRPGEPHRYDVTEDALNAYAQATGGGAAGPVFAIVPAWETIPAASRSVASDDARRRIVHAAQDIHVHAPIEAGMSLVTTATPIGIFARRSGAALVIRAETRDDGLPARSTGSPSASSAPSSTASASGSSCPASSRRGSCTR